MRNFMNIVEGALREVTDTNSPDYDGLSYDASDPVVKKYVEGWCYALAIAHYRRFGWPIYCLGADDNDFAEYGEDTEFFHGMVMHPSGVVLDITGPHTPSEFVEKWGEPIFRMGDDKTLLRHLNDFMRRQSLADLSKASHIIDTYMKPRWPNLYK
jgi:hypothetical protein